MASKVSDDIVYGRQALTAGEPWIVPDALTYLEGIVEPTWEVFEWGAGGSTVWFAKHCSVVTTIEQSQKWTADIKGKLKRRSLDNVALQYIPIRSTDDDYADAILSCPDRTFNLISVDGEVAKRDRSLSHSWARVVPGGWVMLDNSNWWKGTLPEGWTRIDFIETGLRWVGIRDPFDWQTSFFRKGASCT